MDINTLIIINRQIAWEKVKGDLNAIKSTFNYNVEIDSDELYKNFNDLVEKFIESVENEIIC